jgi:hypothetical protein
MLEGGTRTRNETDSSERQERASRSAVEGVVRVKCAVMAVGVVGITKMRARGTCRQPAVIYLAPPSRQASLSASKGALRRQRAVRGCKLYGGGLSCIRLELKRCVFLRVAPSLLGAAC